MREKLKFISSPPTKPKGTMGVSVRIAKLVGAPYLPLSPTLLPLPLPAKCVLTFGPPMRFEGSGNEDDETVTGHVREVEREVERLIAAGRTQRRHLYRS